MVSIVGYLHRFREDTGIGEVPQSVEHHVRVIIKGFFLDNFFGRFWVGIRILRTRRESPLKSSIVFLKIILKLISDFSAK